MRAALVEQDDIAAGNVVALVAADPRRAALSRAVPLRARPRGARRALAAAGDRPAPRQDRAPAVPDLRHPVRLEGVLRRRADALRRPRSAARRRLASPPVEGRHARPRPDPSTRRAARRPRSTTTGSRTTRATRWPWLGPRSPPAAWRSPGSARPGSAPARTAARSPRVSAEDHATGADLRDPDPRRRRRDRRLGRRARPSVRRRLAADPAEPRRPPRRPARADPEQDRADHPRPGQDRLPRPVARPLADRHDRRPVRGPARPPVRGRLGGGPAARHGQRDDGRRPDPGRRGRHVRGAPAAHRAVERLHGQGVARASRHGRTERRRPDRRREVHDLPGDGPRRDRRRPRPRRGARRRPSETAERRLVGAADTDAARPDRRRARRRSRPSGRSDRRPRHGWSPGTGPRRRRWSRSARSWTCSTRSSRAGSSSRPRSPGRSATSSRCRSTTSWRGGRGWPRSCPTAAPRSLRASPRSSAPSSTGATRASALEVEHYLASARREFSVAPPGAPGPADEGTVGRGLIRRDGPVASRCTLADGRKSGLGKRLRSAYHPA